ncbi:MAG: hypothetical protein J0L92_08350 [Deltaproteobacteria bacterium]|nr:hypothetical protein [Deltaproteobacteria bacterium]
MPNGLFLLEGERVTRLNAEMQRLLGVVVGDTLDELLGPAASRVRALRARAQTESASEEVSLVGVQESIPVWLTVSPSFGESGNVCVVSDLRERKRLEHDLRQAQKLEAVAGLAAGVAHEINTPLQFVGDSLEFLGTSWDDVLSVATRRASADEVGLEELQALVPRAFTRMREGLSRVVSIVRSMKLLSHPGTGQTERYDLRVIVEGAVAITVHEHKLVATVAIELADDERLSRVPCLPSELGQVLVALIVNASQAIAEQGTGQRGRITVRAQCGPDAVIIEVEDDGPGIRPEIRERIFEPFFTTKPVGRGTGQGLSIARQIIHVGHGGELTFDSEVGRGTCFRLSLPFSEERA